VALQIGQWLLKKMNARDALDGVAVTVKLAVNQFGSKTVADELRYLAEYLERTGEVPGWKFPSELEDRRNVS